MSGSTLIEEIYSHFRALMPGLPEDHEQGLAEWTIVAMGGGCPDCAAAMISIGSGRTPPPVRMLRPVPDGAGEGSLADVRLLFTNDLEYRGHIWLAAGSAVGS